MWPAGHGSQDALPAVLLYLPGAQASPRGIFASRCWNSQRCTYMRKHCCFLARSQCSLHIMCKRGYH